MKELEQAILDLIKQIYCANYIGKLRVSPVFSEFSFPGELPLVCGYKLDLALNKDERPLSIACDGTAELFLNYVSKELHERNLVSTEYFTAILIYTPRDIYGPPLPSISDEVPYKLTSDPLDESLYGIKESTDLEKLPISTDEEPSSIVITDSYQLENQDLYSSLSSDISKLKTKVSTNTSNINNISNSIGNMEDLTTQNKDTLVEAINEASESGGGLTEDERTALDNLTESQNPLTVTMTGGGNYELGSTYAPSGTFTVKKGTTDVLSSSSISINSGTISGNTWSDSNVESDKTWKITATYNNKSASASVSAKFLPYLYQGVATSADVSEAIIKKLSSTLSTATTRGATNLAANKYYIFACKGSVKLVCRENSTNGIVSATTGTISITRLNRSATDTYSYIIIPASETDWIFKITNS